MRLLRARQKPASAAALAAGKKFDFLVASFSRDPRFKDGVDVRWCIGHGHNCLLYGLQPQSVRLG